MLFYEAAKSLQFIKTVNDLDQIGTNILHKIKQLCTTTNIAAVFLTYEYNVARKKVNKTHSERKKNLDRTKFSIVVIRNAC